MNDIVLTGPTRERNNGESGEELHDLDWLSGLLDVRAAHDLLVAATRRRPAAAIAAPSSLAERTSAGSCG